MIRTALTAGLCLALGAPALAQPGLDDIAQVDVLPGWRTANGTHMAALRVRLAPGWKTYWRAPGEAGIPPRFDFAGSENVESVAFHWPVPEVFRVGDMTSVGYTGELILPMEVRPRDGAAAAILRAEVDLGVCEEICVPLAVSVAADLPNEPVRPDARIRAALADRPATAAEAGAGSVRCTVAPGPGGMVLTADMRLPSQGAGEFAVVELGEPNLWVSEASLNRDGRRLSAEVDVEDLAGNDVAFDPAQVRVTVLGSRGAVEFLGCE